MKKRGCDIDRVCVTGPWIYITISFFLPGILLIKLHFRRLEECDEIFSRFHVEAIIAIAVCRGLLKQCARFSVQIDTYAANAALPCISNVVLIQIQPDLIAQE